VAVAVSGAPEPVLGLSVVVLSGASWPAIVGSLSVDDLDSTGGPSVEVVTPSLELEGRLTAEGQSATVVVYAEYADRTWEDVTSEVTLSLKPAAHGTLSSSLGTRRSRYRWGQRRCAGPTSPPSGARART